MAGLLRPGWSILASHNEGFQVFLSDSPRGSMALPAILNGHVERANSPAAIQARTVSGLTPKRLATSGGIRVSQS